MHWDSVGFRAGYIAPSEPPDRTSTQLARSPQQRQNAAMMNFPKTLTMIGELIALPSISSVEPEFDQGNREVVDCLANWLEAAGFRTEVLPVPDYPDKANLVAQLGSGDGGLVLAGHTDTVPFDQQRWNHDPFRATEQDGNLYGLGTSDMKAFFALALDAVRELDPAKLREPITLLATADEESSMCGARDLVRLGKPKARYAVIGEPTGMRPIRCQDNWRLIAAITRAPAAPIAAASIGVNSPMNIPPMTATNRMSVSTTPFKDLSLWSQDILGPAGPRDLFIRQRR